MKEILKYIFGFIMTVSWLVLMMITILNISNHIWDNRIHIIILLWSFYITFRWFLNLK